MMKYIRNKKGKIFERRLVEYPSGESDIWYVNHNYSLDYDSQQHLIEKESDTIEELCDEFVVAYEDGWKIVYGDLEWAKIKAKASLEVGSKSIIYGAIWTNKGLIYVAKTNEKGELELL